MLTYAKMASHSREKYQNRAKILNIFALFMFYCYNYCIVMLHLMQNNVHIFKLDDECKVSKIFKSGYRTKSLATTLI